MKDAVICILGVANLFFGFGGTIIVMSEYDISYATWIDIIASAFLIQIAVYDKTKEEITIAGIIILEVLITPCVIGANLTGLVIGAVSKLSRYLWKAFCCCFQKKRIEPVSGRAEAILREKKED